MLISPSGQHVLKARKTVRPVSGFSTSLPGMAGNGQGNEFYERSIEVWAGTNASVYNYEKQQTLERYQIRQNGRWASIRVDNSKGICDVLAVSVDGIGVADGLKLLA